MWTGPLYRSYVTLVREEQERARQAEEARVSAREQAERVEASRQRAIAADEQAAAARLAALQRAAENQIKERKAAEARAAAVSAEMKAAARLADETEARAKAEKAEAQARYGVEAAKRRAQEARQQADNADERARADREEADRRFTEAHPELYAPKSSHDPAPPSTTKSPNDGSDPRSQEAIEEAATTSAVTSKNYVACKMLNSLVTASQAIVKGDWDVGAALVNAGECIMINKGTSVRVKIADAEKSDPKVVCVQIRSQPACLWVPTSILEER